MTDGTVGKHARNAVTWALAGLRITVAGAAAGTFVLAIFDAAYLAIRLIWIEGWSAVPSPAYPVIVCTAAGAILALMRRFAKDGEGLGCRLARFFVPLAGGGPVGLLMGLVGFIKHGCARAKRFAIKPLERIGYDEGLGRRGKTVLYAFGIAGAAAGVAAVWSVAGLGVMLPRLDAAPATLGALGLAAGLAVLGWLMGLVYRKASSFAKTAAEKTGKLRALLPLACGIILGLSMAILPHAGLPGSDAYSFQLTQEWAAIAPAALAATAIVRVLLTAAMINMDWNGGPFMPLVFAAICMGFALAGAFGLDAGCATAALGSAILVSFSGKPLFAVAMLLCSPIQSAPVIAVAALVAALLVRGERAIRERHRGAAPAA